MRNEFSLIDAAVEYLQKEKKPCDVYQLFDIVAAKKGLTEDAKGNVITKFYSDLTTSAKFVYAGDNTWDLKANQKIELWEKDGSFYKEYTKVELPDEFKETPRVIRPANNAEPVEEPEVVKPKPVKKAKATPKAKKVAKVTEPVEVVEQVTKPEVVEVVEEVVEGKTDKPVIPVVGSAIESYEEEVFEEADEFDEEKYNEYMDTYEDQYKD